MDYARMTDAELWDEIERIYGEDWTAEQMDQDSELFKEYIKRIATGY